VREISVVSLTEIAVKQTRGKLTFSPADAMTGVADLRVRVLPYAAEHAFRLFDLPTHHADPSTARSSRKRSWKTSRS
jgi:PIN domain nuclease of toxin-antitoxin system